MSRCFEWFSHVSGLQVVSVFCYNITNHKVTDYLCMWFSWIRIIPYIVTHIQQNTMKNNTFSHWQLNVTKSMLHVCLEASKKQFQHTPDEVKINIPSTSVSRLAPSTMICGEALTSRFLLSHVVCSREEPAMVTMASTTLWVTS